MFRTSQRWAEPRHLLTRARRDVGAVLRLRPGVPPIAARARGLMQPRSWQPIPDDVHTALLACGAPKFGGLQWSDVPTHGASHVWLPLREEGHRLPVGRGLCHDG